MLTILDNYIRCIIYLLFLSILTTFVISLFDILKKVVCELEPRAA